MRLNRKWILVIALVVSMATAISGTLAYLQDSATAKNTFTVGNVDIDLFEGGWTEGSTPALLPGVEITKEPYIVNNKSDAWVWMKITVPNDLMSYIDWNSEGGWAKTDDGDADNDGYTIVTMKWPELLKKDDKTNNAFTRVLLDASLKEMPEGLVNDNGTIDIVVDAFAIQDADAINSIDEAIAAFGTSGEGGDEPGDNPSDYSSSEAITAAKTKYNQENNTNFFYAGADASKDSVYLYFNENGGTYEVNIVGSGNMVDYAAGESHVNGIREGNTPVTVSVADGVTHIGDYTFYKAYALSGDIIIPDSVTSVGEMAFGNGKNDKWVSLGSLTLGKNLQVIENGAFNGCSFDGDIVIPASVTTLGGGTTTYGAFQSVKATGTLKFETGSKLQTIGAGTFKNCTCLPSVLVLPNSVAEVGEAAFSNCNNVRHVVVPASATTVDTSLLLYQVDALNIVYFVGDVECDVPTNRYVNTAIARTNGGTFTDSTSFSDGELATPTKSGSTFGGWFTDKECTVPATSVERATVYYAKWN